MLEFHLQYVRYGQTKLRYAVIMANCATKARAKLACRPDELGWGIMILSCEPV